jgi:cytochrome P450
MSRTLAEINFFSPEIVEDPFAANALARREAPVHHVPSTPIFMVSTFDLINEAALKPEVFSNNFSEALQGRAREDAEIKAVLAQGWPQVNTLLTADPPEHTRFRKLVNLAFSPGRVNKLEGGITEIVDGLIDKLLEKRSCEFVSEFCVPLPVTVIADQLGVPRADLKLFKEWSDAFADRLGGMLTRDQELECAKKIVAFQHYMKAKLDERTREPRDDLLSDLVQARVEGERPLDTAELLNIVQQLLVAGNETTTNTIAAGMLLLVQNPDQLAKVQANPELVKNMVEEVLRLETPTNSMWRVVKQDAELGGVAIPKGSMVMLRFGSGNRDEAKFPDPDRFDVERKNANLHLSFGRGIHTCIGAMLSRKETNVAFRRLLARMQSFRLAPGNDLKHHSNVLLRGLRRLEIEYEPAGATR